MSANKVISFESVEKKRCCQVAPFLPATVLSILFWDLASVRWHVDQQDAVGLTEAHGQVVLPGHQRAVVIFTLVQIATTEDEAEAAEDLAEEALLL